MNKNKRQEDIPVEIYAKSKRNVPNVKRKNIDGGSSNTYYYHDDLVQVDASPFNVVQQQPQPVNQYKQQLQQPPFFQLQRQQEIQQQQHQQQNGNNINNKNNINKQIEWNKQQQTEQINTSKLSNVSSDSGSVSIASFSTESAKSDMNYNFTRKYPNQLNPGEVIVDDQQQQQKGTKRLRVKIAKCFT